MTTATSGNGVGGVAAQAIKEKSVYQGRVTKQVLTHGKDDVPYLTISVRLEGELSNSRKPDAGMLDCPKIEADVLLILQEDNEERLGYVANDLARLGFESDNLELLNPEAKGHISFVGKTAFVTPRFVMKNEDERVYWNFRFPKEFDNKPVAKGTLAKSPVAAKWKELVNKRKTEKVESAAKDGAKIPF